MAVNAPVAPAARPRRAQQIRRHQWGSVLRAAARTPRGTIGLGLTLFVVLVAVIGPFVAPNAPDALVTLPYGKPSGQFLLGGDALGRDVLSRVLGGGWVLLIMAVGATVLGVAGGAAAGVSAAYLRGISDGIIMRAVDVILAFPQLVFALLLLSLLGPKLWLITIAVGVSHAPQVARVLRSATLDLSERDFVKAAELQGMRPTRIDAEGDPAQPDQPADGGGGAPADLLDRDHGRAGVPRFRAASACRELGDDDQREPGSACR